LKVDSEKVNCRVYPKVSPLNQTSSSGSEFKQPLQTANSTNQQSGSAQAKLLSSRHLVQFDRQTNALKRKIDDEFAEFFSILNTFIKLKTNWQGYSM
jgi:hypothetical protein